jgi:hypothetical protein
VHAPDSTAGQTRASRDLQRARARYERAEALPVGTLIGLNERGLLGATHRGYNPSRHAAFDQLLIHITWRKILELLEHGPDAGSAGT